MKCHPPVLGSFDALKLCIQSQKPFPLTQSEVDRFCLLRDQVAAEPEHFSRFQRKGFFNYPLSSTHIIHSHKPQLDDSVFHFDHQANITAEVQVKSIR